MKRKIGRTLLVALVVELLAIVVLVALVAAMGPSDPDAATAYAERLGNWVGPIAGFVLCIAGGWFVARSSDAHQLQSGLLLGTTVAVIDVALLVLGGAGFRVLFVVSNLGRIVGGGFGGWLAGRRRVT